jgi:hypothetical protein
MPQERIREEEDEQIAGDRRSEDADLAEHLADLETLFRRLGLGEALTHEHHAIGEGGDQKKTKLHFPAHASRTERPANQATDDHACGPGGVQDVEIVRAILGVEGRDQRIRNGLERAVGEGEHKGAPVKELVGGFLRLAGPRRERDEGRHHVEEEGRKDQLAVANLVHHHAANDDSEAEPGEPGAANGTELRAGEAEISSPVGKNASSDAKADTGGKDGGESSPEEPARVR